MNVLPAARGSSRGPSRQKRLARVLAVLLSASLMVQPVRAEGLPDLGEPSQADLSPQMERRIGESLMRETRWQDPTYLDDPEVEDYLNRLGGRLVAANPDARGDFQFFAKRDATLNAFAWPGGFIGVHTGLILAAESESELASVLAHEVSHVTQRHIVRLYARQGQSTAAVLAGLLIAVLASRGNSQVSEAAMASAQAAGIQSQLNFTREFEREADRIGLQTLTGAGFDGRAMSSFFDRLQKYNRLYDSSAPAYLRTHPLTTERIADIENRVSRLPYKQTPDSLEFSLLRAKLRAQLGAPDEAMTDLSALLKDRRWPESAARYGLARAALRAGKVAVAQSEMAKLRRANVASPIIETLAADIYLAAKDTNAALGVFRSALAKTPSARALQYGYLEALIAAGDQQQAATWASAQLRVSTQDATLLSLAARAYGALGKRATHHRLQAEVYVLKGNLLEAIDQLNRARDARDGDFYEQSMIDSRLAELKKAHTEELREARQR